MKRLWKYLLEKYGMSSPRLCGKSLPPCSLSSHLLSYLILQRSRSTIQWRLSCGSGNNESLCNISAFFSLFPKRTNFTSTTVKYYKALNKSHPLPLSFSLSFPRELTIIFHYAHFHFLLQKKKKSKWMLQAHMSSRLITIWFLWVLRIVFTFSQFLYNGIHIS